MKGAGPTENGMRELIGRSAATGSYLTLGLEGGESLGTLSTQEVAQFLGVSSPESVVRRVLTGELPALQQGREMRFLRSDVETYARVLRSTKS